MKILVDGGLVFARKEGKWTYYSLRKEGFEKAHCFIEEIKNQVE
jgi:ArsR family transcriptional regulator